MASQNVKQVWVHPRPGLMTPYLSEDWFRLWKIALQEAERLDMNVWIYDENSYPSGFAGGLVPEAMPESRGRGLVLKPTEEAPKVSPDIISVYRRAEDGTFQNLTEEFKKGTSLAPGKFLVASEVRAGDSPWHGNRCYVNLLSPGVTEKFLELTLEPYRREIGEHFGKRVPGVFTDEPNIRPAGGFPWSEVLQSEFKKRWNYDLLDHLPSLAQEVGDWRRIRHNYFQVLHEQFVEHWAKPYFNYCETNQLQFTGHYWDHDWPDCMGVPDNMAMYAWHQLPAIDCLMNQYAEHTHAQFGNVRMVKELSSVANQLGRKQTLCEIYGAGGWDLRFEDMKRIGDWLEVLGVNVLNQHLSYVTIRGARKRDHPQSFSYHASWWRDYHVSADYFARISAALTQGEQINSVLVIQPTTTAWMYQGEHARLQEIGDSFFKLLMALEAAQIEYDLASEDIIANHGRNEGHQLVIGKRAYDHIIVPPFTENLNSSTRGLIRNARVHFLGKAPPRTDGRLPAEEVAGAQQPVQLDQLINTLVAEAKNTQTAKALRVERTPQDRGILSHHRRTLEDGELLFLVNTSIQEASSGVVFSRLGGVEQWEPYSGKVQPYPFTRGEEGISAKFELPPSGSILLFFSREPVTQTIPPTQVTVIQPTDEVHVKRLEPNVLVLDYVDVTAGGESLKDTYFYNANQFIWQKNGMKRNPWDSAVQYKRELIDLVFPEYSGFEARYTFTIDRVVPKDLAVVIERPDLYTITCNGNLIKAKKNDWWLDKAFGRIDIARHAKPGVNVITLKASPFTMFHELEPAYLLGDFSLKPVSSGFVVTSPEPLQMKKSDGEARHGINPDGTMWLSAGIGYGRDSDDRAPFVILDLGKPTALSAIRIWNYNENHARDLTTRGARTVRISAGATREGCSPVATLDLEKAAGKECDAQDLKLSIKEARFVKIECLANHNGVTFPAQGTPEDNGFVGLAEVEFLTTEGKPVECVEIAACSSELSAHNRQARNLVNRSGLSEKRHGWNTQGHPFYSAGVTYSEKFNLGKRTGTYAVSMPQWYGAVARVSVNGKPAGHIDAPPWECDITQQVRNGENTVDVTILGTPKNLMGPHHGSPALGAAWPGNFQRGPNPGPPPGEGYSNVAYGLFEPFFVKQRTEQTESQ
jgi:hypothetical protein